MQETGQRSLVAYLRSVFLQPNHDVFDVQKLPAAEYALSLGLPTAPKLRFLKHAGKQVKHVSLLLHIDCLWYAQSPVHLERKSPVLFPAHCGSISIAAIARLIHGSPCLLRQTVKCVVPYATSSAAVKLALGRLVTATAFVLLHHLPDYSELAVALYNCIL